MAIGGAGFNPASTIFDQAAQFTGIASGMSAGAADAGLEAAESKKRADGVKNAWKTAENQNTSGIKAASDALRL